MKTLINKTRYGSVHKEVQGDTYSVSFNNEFLNFPKEEYFLFVRHIWQTLSKLGKDKLLNECERQIVAVFLDSQIIDLRLNFLELKALNDLLNPTLPYAKSYTSRKLDRLKIVAFYN